MLVYFHVAGSWTLSFSEQHALPVIFARIICEALAIYSLDID